MYPNATIPERIADGAVHALGVVGAVFGAAFMLIWASGTVSPAGMTALAIYGTALIATFAASAVYNMMPYDAPRPILRRIDHAAIYLKIAGTYTPLVVMIGSGFAYLILAIVWALAIIGMTFKLFFWRKPGRFGPVLYLVMGWLSVGLIFGLWPIVPDVSMILIVVGGLLYTGGVPFFAATKLRFSTAIWHAFVVAASACFFAAIAYAAPVMAVPAP